MTRLSRNDDQHMGKSYGSRFEQGSEWSADLLDDLRREIGEELRVHRPKYTKAVLAAFTPEQHFVRRLLFEAYNLLIQFALGRGELLFKADIEASDPAFFLTLEMVTSEQKEESSRPSRLQRKPEPKHEGSVYFIRAEGTNFVKIGVSVGSSKRRLNGLQTGSPFTLRLIAEIAGTIKDERALHRRFGHLRERGEWFRLEGELSEFVNGLQATEKHCATCTCAAD